MRARFLSRHSLLTPRKKNTPQKRIALFMDGTWNLKGRKNNGENNDTNVVQLYEATRYIPAIQHKHYIPGVGTEEKVSWLQHYEEAIKAGRLKLQLRWLPRTVRNALGGVSGYGTDFNIKSAYTYLCQEYNEHARDHIYLFGFSRGAFAARSLSGFVDTVGLLLKDQLHLVETAYALYAHPAPRVRKYLPLLLRKVSGFSKPSVEDRTDLPVYFIGVWDTVASMGIAGFQKYLPRVSLNYHETDLPKSVSVARHALALHELRAAFEPLIWKNLQPGRDVQQVWFPGAHADVGGGYREDERELSNCALDWMAWEARKNGLEQSQQAFHNRYSPEKQQVHHEIQDWFVLSAPTARKHLLNPETLDAPTFASMSIHPSAIERLTYPQAVNYDFKHKIVNWRLRDVDDATWSFHLKLIAAKPDENGLLSLLNAKHPLLPKSWWSNSTSIDVAKAWQSLHELSTGEGRLSAKEQEQVAKAVAILAMSLDEVEFPYALTESIVGPYEGHWTSILHALYEPKNSSIQRKMRIYETPSAGQVVRRIAISRVINRIKSLLPENTGTQLSIVFSTLPQRHKVKKIREELALKI